jgi:DNA repair ATPase RecN
LDDERARKVAELEYLKGRVRELTAELENAGINADDLTSEGADRIAERVTDDLRRRGNEALADEWSAAFSDWKTRNEKLWSLVARLKRRAQATDDDTATLAATRAAADEAAEQFERVRAQAAAWLTKNGGG